MTQKKKKKIVSNKTEHDYQCRQSGQITSFLKINRMPKENLYLARRMHLAL